MWLSREPTAGLHSSQSSGLLWNREGLMALRVRCSVYVCVCQCAYGWVCKCSHAWRGYGSPNETADLYTTTHTYPDVFMMNALTNTSSCSLLHTHTYKRPRSEARCWLPVLCWCEVFCSTWSVLYMTHFIALRYVASLCFTATNLRYHFPPACISNLRLHFSGPMRLKRWWQIWKEPIR